MADVIMLLPAGTGSGITGTAHDTGDLKDEAEMIINVSATPTVMNVTLQGSEDGTNWFTVGTPFTALTPGINAVAATGFLARWFRAVTGTLTGATVGVQLAFQKT
jgi:hypothetical protein